MSVKPDTEKYQRRVSQIYEMIDLAASIGITFDLEEILSKVLRLSEEIMGAEASSLMLLDEEREELYYEVARGAVGDKLKQRFTLKLGQGIAGWVAQTGEPLLVKDAYQDPRFHRRFDEETGFRTKSILCLPLKIEDRVIGIAQVINKRSGGVFDREDQDLFKAFCQIAAVRIENARLHQREVERQRMLSQLEFAKEIQKSFLPSEFPELRDYRFQAVNYTAYQVGGDLYDVFPIGPEGEKVCFILGDVAGKGVSAALYMARFLSDLRHMAVRFHDDPGALLTALNELLIPRSLKGIFITAFLGFLDRSTGELKLANAGHCSPILASKSKGVAKTIVPSSGPPLGIIERIEYRTERVSMEPGEILVIYTDGVSEAANADDEQYGEERLKQLLLNKPFKNIEHCVNSIYRSVMDFAGKQKQRDDITLLLVERTNG